VLSLATLVKWVEVSSGVCVCMCVCVHVCMCVCQIQHRRIPHNLHALEAKTLGSCEVWPQDVEQSLCERTFSVLRQVGAQCRELDKCRPSPLRRAPHRGGATCLRALGPEDCCPNPCA